MSASSQHDDWKTRATIFDRLKAPESGVREGAWGEFRQRYAPVVAGFARNLGARPQDVDDLIQDVFFSFFSVSPKFVYDPAKGRFRGYLKTVTLNAIRTRWGDRARVKTVPLSEMPDNAEPITETWEETWHHNLMRIAIAHVREQNTEHPKTFEAFERYVLKGEPAADVAQSMGLSVDSVYQAKHRITDAIRARFKELDQED